MLAQGVGAIYVRRHIMGIELQRGAKLRARVIVPAETRVETAKIGSRFGPVGVVALGRDVFVGGALPSGALLGTELILSRTGERVGCRDPDRALRVG